MQAADLHSLEVCSRGCQQMVNRPALWQNLLVQRFGQLTADQLSQTTTHLSVLELKQKYVQLSRQIIPAPEMQVLPKCQVCAFPVAVQKTVCSNWFLHTGCAFGKGKYTHAVSGSHGNGGQYVWECFTFAEGLLAGHLSLISGMANSNQYAYVSLPFCSALLASAATPCYCIC